MRNIPYLVLFSVFASILLCVSPTISSINVCKNQKITNSSENEEYELTIISGLNGLKITILCDPSIKDEFSWEFIDTVMPAEGSEVNFTTDNGDGRIRIIVLYEWIIPVLKGDITVKVFRNNQLIKEVYGTVVLGFVDFIHPDIKISVNKNKYEDEETINVLFNNNGHDTYRVYKVFVSINANNDEDFDPFTKEIDEVVLSEGESKTVLEWNQIDGKGNKVPKGRYSAYIEFYEDGVNYEQRNIEFSISKVRSRYSLFYQFLKIFLARGGRFELPRS